MASGLPARSFRLPTSAKAVVPAGELRPAVPHELHLQMIEAGNVRERRSYSEALEKWFNAAYLPLMKEKGAEVKSRVKAIVGGV